MKERKKGIGIYIVIAIITIWSLIITLYSYPVQDDFYYAYNANKLMNEGYNLFSMAWKKTVDYYMTFTGCYTSSFLGFFVSGIINCNIFGIRVYEFFSLILFYISLFMLIKNVSEKVFGYTKDVTAGILLAIMVLLNGIIYYVDHEDFYWFITSVQYLTICSFIFIGVSFYIDAVVNNKNKSLFLSCIFGILGSGGALNIAALCCILYMLVFVWGFVSKKDKRYLTIPFATAIIFAVVNGLAPGNYIRAGRPVGISDIILAAELSVKYACLRLKRMLYTPVFIVTIVILLFFALSKKENTKKSEFMHRMPILVTVILFILVAVIIFPVMLGYGWDVYLIICRSNFISDISIYIFTIIATLYWTEWIAESGIIIYPSVKTKILYIILVICCVIRLYHMGELEYVPFIRQAQDVVSGRCEAYSKYCIGMYDTIKESEADEVTIYLDKQTDDITCMVNPAFYIGWYDYKKEHANKSIAEFFGKKAVYVIEKESGLHE